MANVMFPLETFDCYGFTGDKEGIKGYQSDFPEAVEWTDLDSLLLDYNSYQGNSFGKGVTSSDQQVCPEFFVPVDFTADVVPASIQSFQEPVIVATGLSYYQNASITENHDLVEPKNEKTQLRSLAALELLHNYRAGFERLTAAAKLNASSKETCPPVGTRELSTEEVMRVAGARYIQFSVQKDNDLSMLTHPFGSMLSSLTEDEIKDVELAHLLLASAEKIGNQQFERASRLLTECDYLSSNVGNPVQRVVYYFTDALRERIDRETGRMSSKVLRSNIQWAEEIEKAMMGPHPALLACHELLPFSKVIQFTQIQSILDNLASAKRIHLIDLGLRIGMHWTILMQALAVRLACPLELLKISAVGTSKEKIDETGKWLVSFAQTLNLPFSFKMIIVSDMKDIKEDLFELDADEVVGIHAPLVMGSMIFRPDCLENLMKVIRNLNPCVISVYEVEANQNKTSFVNRFIEALFFYSAWFDCLDTCMDGDDCNRTTVEANFFALGIRNSVASEGKERVIRYVGIETWRSFFVQYGFTEIEISQLAMYQANLIVKQFPCGNSCTLEMKGKSLTVGWKGTPLQSISAWKLN